MSNLARPGLFYFAAVGVIGLSLGELHAQSSFSIEPNEIQHANHAIEAALRRVGDFHYDKTPLTEVAADIGRRFQVPVRIDKEALEDVVIDPQTPISCNHISIPAEQWLDTYLEQIDVDWEISAGQLVFSTEAKLESQLQTRVYPVGDLVLTDKGDHYEADYDSLIRVITTAIAPDSWDEVGGPGSVTEFHTTTSLVISQTGRTHRKLNALMESLRTVRQVQSQGPVTLVNPATSAFGSRLVPSPNAMQPAESAPIHDRSAAISERPPSWRVPIVHE